MGQTMSGKHRLGLKAAPMIAQGIGGWVETDPGRSGLVLLGLCRGESSGLPPERAFSAASKT
jgi:hypothetical protein